MFKDAKVGDKVWSIPHGWGVISKIDTSYFPLEVKFETKTETFKFDGKPYFHNLYPTLFWGEVKFEVPDKPLPDLHIDTKVIVWNVEDGEKYKRYFKKFDEDGNIICFPQGKTSWSTHNTDLKWDCWELAE